MLLTDGVSFWTNSMAMQHPVLIPDEDMVFVPEGKVHTFRAGGRASMCHPKPLRFVTCANGSNLFIVAILSRQSRCSGCLTRISKTYSSQDRSKRSPKIRALCASPVTAPKKSLDDSILRSICSSGAFWARFWNQCCLIYVMC
jgi:hypothetical protein